jgi:uncharacterized membrane protein
MIVNVVDLVSRWLHVGTAIVLLGGAAFQWLVLRPAARQLSDAEHSQLRERVQDRWRKIVGIGIGLLLLTGFYNYLVAPNPADLWKAYHPIMGIKILVALAVFFLASALAGRAAAFARLREQAGTWLPVLLLLGTLVVALSGYLKIGGAKALRAHSTATPVAT